MKAALARIFLCPFGQHARVWKLERHLVQDTERMVLRCTNCGECLASGAWRPLTQKEPRHPFG